MRCSVIWRSTESQPDHWAAGLAGARYRGRDRWRQTRNAASLGNRESVGWSAINVRLAAQETGDSAEARAAYEESLAIEAAGPSGSSARALLDGEVAPRRRHRRGSALSNDTYRLRGVQSNKSGLVDALRGLGDAARLEGDVPPICCSKSPSPSAARSAPAWHRGGARKPRESGRPVAMRTREVPLWRGPGLWAPMDDAQRLAAACEGLAELIIWRAASGWRLWRSGRIKSLREQIGAAVPPPEAAKP